MSDFMDSAGAQKLVRLTDEGAVPIEDVADDQGDVAVATEELLRAILLEITAMRMAVTELVNKGSEDGRDFLEEAREFIGTTAGET